MKQNIAIKYVAAVAAVALFLGLTVWLVRNEGRRTRESIREAAKEAGGEVRKGLVEGAERVVDKAAEVPGKIVHDVTQEVTGAGSSVATQVVGEAGKVSRDILGGVKDILRPADASEAKPGTATPPDVPSSPPSPTAKEEPPSAAAQEHPAKILPQAASPPADMPPQAPVPPVPPAKDPPAPAPLETTPSPVSRPAGDADPGSRNGKKSAPATPQSDSPAAPIPSPRAKPAKPADPIGQLFDLGHQVSKAVDEVGQEALALSWEEEQQVGRDVHQMVAREHQLLRPPAVIERLQRLARPIANQRTRKEVTFTLEVIKSDEVNAFAHAGGYVYVNTGMLDFAKPDAELQFFLAHEIAHQELKHVVKRMTYAARASQVGGQAASTLAQMAYLTIATGYSKEQELEADAWAFRSLLHAGRSRDEALSGMRHILVYVNQKKLEPKRSEPRDPAGKTLQQIENHFRSHPPTDERLKQLEGLEG